MSCSIQNKNPLEYQIKSFSTSILEIWFKLVVKKIIQTVVIMYNIIRTLLKYNRTIKDTIIAEQEQGKLILPTFRRLRCILRNAK